MPGDLTISRRQIEAWKAQIVALQRKVTAAEVLMEEEPTLPPAGILEATHGQANGHDQPEPKNFMGAVVRIANNSPEPIMRELLRQQLQAEGFDPKQIKAYLNVAISKTKKAGRITAYDNGSIWKAPSS